MYISNMLSPNEPEDCMDDDIEESVEHHELEERLRKTLYYGRPPGSDRPSMPLTELAVEYFRGAAPRGLGRVDMEFAANVGRKAYASPCSLMVGLMYVNRLKKHGNTDYLQRVASQDLFLISMLIASKYLYDEGTDEEVFNDEWADAAGLDTEDINELEREFLQETGWNLYVDEKEFADVLRKVEMTIAFRKGRERGGTFTYTELHALTDDLNLLRALNAVLVELMKVVMMCCAAYLAGTVTLALSPTILSLMTSQRVNTGNQTLVSSPYVDVSSANLDQVVASDGDLADAEHSTLPTNPCVSCSESCTKSGSNLNSYPGSPQQSVLSVIKDFIGLWLLPSASVSMNSDWLCEYGPCGYRQQGSALECVNVTSQSMSCPTSPCCCCQPMPSLDRHSFTNFPHTQVTSLGFRTEAVR